MRRKYDRTFNVFIRKLGEEIIIRRRTVDESGNIISYSEPEVIKGIVEQITGYTELWERLGLIVEADYRVTFTADTQVDVGDILIIRGEECTVAEKLLRKFGDTINSVECLVRKRT